VEVINENAAATVKLAVRCKRRRTNVP